jgi:hypothetical protein
VAWRSDDQVIRELAAIAFADIGDLLDHHGRLRPLAEAAPTLRSAVRRVQVRRV